MRKESVILLILFIIIGVILNFLPHLGYDYPMHADEWTHLTYAKNLLSQGPLYFGGSPGKDLEIGFHVILASFNYIGVPYFFMFKFFPAIMTILICLSVFIWVRQALNEKAALFAVLFVVLLKSSILLLGPVYFLPLSFGLLLIPLGLYLLEIKSRLFFLPFTALLYIHPPSALAFFLVAVISILYKREKLVQNFALLVLGGVLALPLYLDIFMKKGVATLNMLVFKTDYALVSIPEFLGYLIFALVVIGLIFAIIRKKYLLVLYLAAFFILIVLYWVFQVQIFIYDWRILMYFFLISSAFFGLACQEIIDFRFSKKAKYAALIILVVLILAFSLPSRLDANKQLYKIIDNKDYQAFIWIKNNTSPDSIAVLDPFKGYAFTPVAERRVYSKVMPGNSLKYDARNDEIENFFSTNCTNLTFLDSNNISIIYGNCSNTSLYSPYANVYFQKTLVTRIIDGDTFELVTGEKVRLICIDTPEKGDKGYEEAKVFLSSMILNKPVRLEKDVSETDSYGRLLRYVYVEDVFVNKEIVKQGYGAVFAYGNDTKRCGEIKS